MEENKKNRNFKVNGRVWIDSDGLSFIGHGKIELLEKTKELGSLRKAAIEMNMSYRQAWYSINKMNKTAPTPLIILKRGGNKGGSATITDFGEKIINYYDYIQTNFDEFLKFQNSNQKF